MDGICLKDFGAIHLAPILSVCLSENGFWLYTSDSVGNLKKWRVNDMSLVKHYVDVHKTGICTIGISC